MVDRLEPDWFPDNVLVPGRVAGYDPLVPAPAAQWRAWWRQRAGECVGNPAAELAARQGFVVTTGQLAALGWQPHDVRREIRRARWSRPARGILSPVVVEGDDHAARRRRHALASTAGALCRPDHVISAGSAAIVHGLPTVAVPRRPVLTTAGTDALGRRDGVDVRGATLDAAAIEAWFGASVTTVARTLVDQGRHSRRDALMAADAALREQLVTQHAIAVELIGAAGWPGVCNARDVLALASPLAESALESITRLALHDDRFPPPQLQVEIGGYRVDFCWRDRRLILEADGREKYTDDELWREKRRETRLRALGYRVERVLWSDVTRDWPETSRRLRVLFAS